MKSLLLFFIVLPFLSNTLSGQIIYSGEKRSGDLFFGLKTIGFIRNKEYFNPKSLDLVYMGYMLQQNHLIWDPGFGYVNPNIEGYTLIGDFFQPKLVYYPNQNLSLSAGAHFLYYSGAGKMTEIKPILSVNYDFSERTSVTFGSLEGCENRKLFDPIFDFERMYTNNSESGFELVTDQNHFTSTTWLDWENFIFKGDDDREIINFGESFKYSSDKFLDNFDFKIPVQFMIRHLGGQISNYPENLETYLNLATGLNINYYSDAGIFGADYCLLLYYDNSSPQVLSFKQGYANWYKLYYNYHNFRIEMAYWKSHDFYAPIGNLVYSSVSGYYNNTILSDRSLISSSCNINILRIKYLEMYFGIDFYYDPHLKQFYNAAALHLSFNEMTKLFSFKK